jgi:hypothetical protein
VFVTVPDFEQFVPPGLKLPEQQYWIAASLSQGTPWYLFTYESECDGGGCLQTVLAAWESSLIALLCAVPPKSRKAVARFDLPLDGSSPQWTVKWIEALWKTSEEEVDLGPLAFRVHGENVVRDSFLQPVAINAKRELLFKI